MLRVISELRPRYVLAENVRGAVNLALDTVYANLVNEGYKVYPHVIPASAVGAPHQRERLFVIGVREDVANAYKARLQGRECPELSECPREFSFRTGGALCPTPQQRDFRSGDKPSSTRAERKERQGWSKNLNDIAGGQLNPDWVGQLMGYPEGWTDLDVDEPKEWAGWPALLGQEQYPFEYPRTTTGCKNRAKQLRAYGNSVVPAQAYPFFRAIVEIERRTTNDC